MSVNTPDYLKRQHGTAHALGEKKVSSDFTFSIRGHEETYLLVKQAPWPVVTSQGSIEIVSILGTAVQQPQQGKTYFESPITFQETMAGTIDKLLVDLIREGRYFDAKIYEGTPQRYLSYKPLDRCFVQLDAADRDWENRSQVLTFSGTLYYNYYGETVKGNSDDYR